MEGARHWPDAVLLSVRRAVRHRDRLGVDGRAGQLTAGVVHFVDRSRERLGERAGLFGQKSAFAELARVYGRGASQAASPRSAVVGMVRGADAQAIALAASAWACWYCA